MEAPPSSPVAVEQDNWQKRAEEKRASIRASQIKYYEKKKEEGLLDRLKENYDPIERKKRYEIEKKERNILQKQKEYNLRKKQEAEAIIVQNALVGASEGKRKLLEQLVNGGVFNLLTLKQKREILNSK
jgi:hypothetical protein